VLCVDSDRYSESREKIVKDIIETFKDQKIIRTDNEKISYQF
jgi:hypothetical protein